jgi:hypothetical protein
MKRLFTVLSLTFLLSIIQSHSANALTELPTAKCNKKCQEEKKANKNACKIWLKTYYLFQDTQQAYFNNQITGKFAENEIFTKTQPLISEITNKTRPDLKVYLNELYYWYTFYGSSLSSKNYNYEKSSFKEIIQRWNQVYPICPTPKR